MKSVEELKAQITALVQAEQDTARLEYLLYTIQHPDAELPALSEAEEAELALGMADIEAGRVVDADQVWSDLEDWRQQRKAGDRHAG